MDQPTDLTVDPRRDATDSIRGYVYQIYQSALTWIQLKEDEILVLEGAEDFDIYSGTFVKTVQVKDLSNHLTLKSKAVVDSLNNYWSHFENNPDHDVFFRFLTTANAGQEKGSPFISKQKGLEYWQKAESAEIDIEPLRTFLATLGLKQELLSFINKASAEELRKKLICKIKWDLGNKPREPLEYVIEDKLKIHGYKLGINSVYSCQVLPHILKEIADLLSTKGIKKLYFSDFISSFDKATTISIPRNKLELTNSHNDLQTLIRTFELAEISKLSNKTTITPPIPSVEGCISRSRIVEKSKNILTDQHIIFLQGSSGIGKTNLASLISQEMGGAWGWATFRDIQSEQVQNTLKGAAFEINSNLLAPLLILDDINLKHISSFERDFLSLVFSIININGMIIITSTANFPTHLFPKLWIKESCEVNIPYFDESEIQEMARAHGCSKNNISSLARSILFTTSGHPQLVHARVRNLRSQGWPAICFNDLIKPKDVERMRFDVQSRLTQEITSENTRILAYRLSIIQGAFSRDTAIAVAESRPMLRLPGEAFNELIGPWIETEREGHYRVSSLLSGVGNSILSKIETNSVHEVIALSILSNKKINQFEFGTAFFHAFMANHIEALTKIAIGVVREKDINIHYLYNTASWFTLVSLKSEQKIIPDDPKADLMLRLAQYKLIIASEKPDNAITIIERIEESLSNIKPIQHKQHFESVAYGTILNTLEIAIPSPIVIRILSRIIDLYDSNISLKEISTTFGENQTGIPKIGENKPAQVLFSYQGVRINGLDDLSELFTALNALSTYKRNHLLAAFKSDIDLAVILINRAWWKEVEDDNLDVKKAVRLINQILLISKKWNVPELSIACSVAMSVILDEYNDSTECALEILDKADEEHPNNASLINQRAKILFHAKRDTKALLSANKALALPGLSNIDYIFCCRSAGIAAANSDDWRQAQKLFLLGVEKSKDSSIQKNMGIGLLADSAFALWKQKNHINWGL